jgi:cobalt-zinc-cadmium efflux system outer membrane protein
MFRCIQSSGALCVATLVLLSVPDGLAAEPPSSRLTLTQALEEASVRSPVLQAQRAVVEQAEGRLITAKTYPHDPEVILEGARREGAGEKNWDRGVRIAQVVQIGGQRGRQARQASAELDAARSRLLREERLLGARVAAAFVETLRVRELAGVERANTELARSIFEVARKRFDAGSAPQMEVNLAQVQLGRAERDLRLTVGAYEVARTALAEVVGLDPAQPPDPEGELNVPVRKPIALSDLVDGALEHRADLQAFRTTIEVTRARIEVARRENIPNLALEGFYGREDGTDRLVGGEIGIRIPLFNRNRGRIAEARAAERQAVADTEATVLQVRQEVAASRARYQASTEAALKLEQQVLGTLEDNLQLLQRSFESGKTSWTEVLIFRREFVDIQRDYIETLSDAQLAGIELDLAAGITFATSDKESQP